MPVGKTWYVPCSPRSPTKIAPEVQLLQNLEGEDWNLLDESLFKDLTNKGIRRDVARDKCLLTQMKFADLLSKCLTFEGSISEARPTFSARDRVAPMKSFGFAYIDSRGKVRITKAGKRLATNKRPEEVFLKQLLKWQYPSYQHRGARYQNFSIFPFVEVLRLLKELGGLTKREIAMFVITMTRSDQRDHVIKQIQRFRKRYQRVRGKTPKRRFILQEHYNLFSRIYSKDIKRGIKIRERRGARVTVEDFVKTKMGNSMDVADAMIRYFRYSALLSIKGDKLVIASGKLDEVDVILSMEFNLNPNYNDVDAFYSYFGDPTLPVLPYETAEILQVKVTELYNHCVGVVQKIQHIDPTFKKVLPALPPLPSMKIEQLKDESYLFAQLKLDLGKKLLELETRRRPEVIKEIIEMFRNIKETIDPSAYLEWNTWRSFLLLDQAEEIRPNFPVDEDLQPLGNAPGNKSDIEGYFGEFVILVEVTLSAGARQYDTEIEPVTRHIGRFQFQESAKARPRKVYGWFIAPEINPATSNYFFVHLKLMSVPEFGGYITTIPMRLRQFIDILKFSVQMGGLSRSEVRDLLERLENLKDVCSNHSEWVGNFPSVINHWKRMIIAKRGHTNLPLFFSQN